MLLRKYSFVAFAALLVAAHSAATASMTRADEPLRWKFRVGDKFDYVLVIDMKMTTGVDDKNFELHQEWDMNWDVLGVDANSGEAVIRQKFDRVKTKYNTPDKSFSYDSKSEEPPSDAAAQVARSIKAITQGEVEITMTSRGEIKGHKIPDELLSALKSIPGDSQLGDMVSAEGFQTMVRHGLLSLPEKALKEGETWKTELETKNKKVGKQATETVYRYLGTREVDGTTFAVIKPEQRFNFREAPQQGAPAEVAQQQSEGEILFDVAKGYLASMNVDNTVTINTATTDGNQIQPKIEQKIALKLSPVKDKRAEETKKVETPDAKDKEK